MIGRVFASYCPGRTAGSYAKKKRKKVPYLLAVLLALAVRQLLELSRMATYVKYPYLEFHRYRELVQQL